MSNQDGRLAKLETIYQRSEPRRYVVLDEQPDGRLVDPVTREAVEPGPKDTVIVIRERSAGPQE
ncbi:MAG: hypothetical protein M3R02_09790 [Chloroflexota bacterium]|nr:hypothetical protein [Chloroflexota bacterium]